MLSLIESYESAVSKEDLDTFWNLLSQVLNIKDVKENEVKMQIMSELDQTSKGFYSLCMIEISKQILVDNRTDYCDIIIPTSRLNILITTGQLQAFYIDESFKKYLAESILFLLPYAVKYFQKTNISSPFKNLFYGVVELIPYTDENIDLFNQYIVSLLTKPNDFHQIVFVLHIARYYEIKDQTKPVIANLVNYMLEKLPSCEFISAEESQLNCETYDTFFKFLKIKFENIYDQIDLETGFQHIFEFIENYIQKENPIKEENDLIRQILSFFKDLIISFIANHDIDEEIKNDISAMLIDYVCPRASYINNKSDFEFSDILSTFCWGISSIGDIVKTDLFFETICNLLSIKTFDEQIASIVKFFDDYYDIDYDNFIVLSNRQIIARLLYTRAKNDQEIITFYAERLISLPEEQINETHLFLISVLNDIVSLLNLNDECLLNLNIRIHEIYEASLSQESHIDINIDFLTFIRLINSSFYIFKKNLDKINMLIELSVKIANKLISNHQNCLGENSSEKDQNETKYSISFTFLCILIKNLQNDDLLNKTVIEFVKQNCQYCITNDAITVISNYAITKRDSDLLQKSIYGLSAECLKVLAYLKGINDKEEEGENEEDNENDEDEKLANHLIRQFRNNISNISNLIKYINTSDSKIFEIQKENMLFELAEKLLSYKLESFEFLKTWSFKNESIVLFSALFSKVPNLLECIEIYIKLIEENKINNYGEWLFPIIKAISIRSDLIDQNYYDLIIPHLTGSIESICKEIDSKSMPTNDFLIFSFLISQFLKLGFKKQLDIPMDDIQKFIDFSNQTSPTIEDCENDNCFNIAKHEIGANNLKLASFLLTQNHSEIMEFLIDIYENSKIVGKEMRIIIIILIDEVLNATEKEFLQDIRQFCLSSSK